MLEIQVSTWKHLLLEVWSFDVPIKTNTKKTPKQTKNKKKLKKKKKEKKVFKASQWAWFGEFMYQRKGQQLTWLQSTGT